MKFPWPLSGQGCGPSLAVLRAGILQVRAGIQCSSRTSGPEGSMCVLTVLNFCIRFNGHL